MNKFLRGKIYKIESNVTGDVYYGSTCEPTLARRLSGHRSQYNQYKQGKFPYLTSFKILESDNYDIVLVENYPCNSKDELYARERFYIQNNDCVNKIIPTRTGKQYKQDNKESIQIKNKIYHANNKESILIRQKKYRQVNEESIKIKNKKYNANNKESILIKQKEYYINNKEHIQIKHKQYREDNKESLKKKTLCACGGQYIAEGKSQHMKTNKHKQYDQHMIQLKEIIEMQNKTDQIYKRTQEQFNKIMNLIK